MTKSAAPSTVCRDTWVGHSQGRMFARVWTPSVGLDPSQPRTPIVLFHDSLGCIDLWRDFPSRLSVAMGREVIAYDRLGFGRSDPKRKQPSLDFIEDELSTYFPVVKEQLNLQRFIAFGHSVGGGMAIHCAAEYPIACEALITESAQAFAEDRTLKSIAEAKEQFKDEQQMKRLRKYHGQKAEWVLHAWTDTWLNPGFAAWSLDRVLSRVRCPVLAIHGEYDEYGSTDHPKMIAGMSTGRSQMEIIKDTFHVPHRERPEEILHLISSFLEPI
jgi:pimeloyl-ACP methyl ester carboxylesterase